MPHASDFAELSRVINSVHNSIRPKEDLANIVTPVFRNDPTQLWKFWQPLCLRDQFITERHCAVGIVACDEEGYIVKVVSRSGDQISL